MPSAQAKSSASPQCTLTSASDGSLAVKLSGPWKMTSGVPDPDSVLDALRDQPPHRLTFDTAEMSDWDSALLTFLLPVAREAAAHEVALDRAGLPEGARKLIDLALSDARKSEPQETPSAESELTRLARWAEKVAVETIGELSFLGDVAQGLGRWVRGKACLRMRDFTLQLQECGVEALPIVLLIGFLVGAIIGFVGATVLATYGATIYTANMVAIAIVRELGALMTAIILSGRTGAAFAANLGTMRTNQEIDALQTVGLNPVDFLVLPRFLALCLMIPLLTAFANIAGIAGGMLVTTTMPNVTLAAYANATLSSLTPTLLFIGLGKSVLFGAIIALVGCRRGLECGQSAAAVGLATTSAVVVSITLIIAIDGLLAVVFNAVGI